LPAAVIFRSLQPVPEEAQATKLYLSDALICQKPYAASSREEQPSAISSVLACLLRKHKKIPAESAGRFYHHFEFMRFD